MKATLARSAFDQIVEHARSDQPRECCGLLVGHEAAIVQILEAVPARNLADDPNRFFLDPVDHIRTRKDARRRGFDVVGYYHSHPHSPAHPSARDLAEATYVDALYLIVSLEASPAIVRVYELAEGAFVEAPIMVVDG